MIVYIDGMFFRLSGIGRIYENLLGALDGAPEVRRVCTVVPKSREDDFRRTFRSAKIDVRFADFLPLSIGDFLHKGGIVRQFRPAPDIFHFPNFNVPFFLGGRIVSTVCDLIPISAHSDLPWVKKTGFRMLAGRALGVSAATICISESMRREILDMYGVPPARLRVIYPWLDDGFLEAAERSCPERRLVDGSYLLFVGNRFAHKNVRTLMEAVRLLVPEFPALKVVVAGARMRRMDDVDAATSDPALAGRVLEFTQASDGQIRNLYAFASAFVFPTFAEGFGIPPLEALAFGVPAVCSDIPVIREVCGDAVTYADPGDAGSFARGIREVLRGKGGDPALVARGRARARLYSRERSLSGYMEIFRRVAAD